MPDSLIPSSTTRPDLGSRRRHDHLPARVARLAWFELAAAATRRDLLSEMLSESGSTGR